jgi:protein-disulfide isomerase
MQCFERGEYAALVESDIKQAGESGVSSTPSFIINGRLKPGSLSPDDFKQIIDEELTKAGLTR